MNQLQRTHQESNPAPQPPVAGGNGGNLEALRRQAAALQSAADAAIRNALSTNSQVFNASMRQEGGQ